MFRTTFPFFAMIGLLALSACGGGGGGGPGGGTGNNGGGFTLSTQTATFTGKIQTAGPPAQEIQIHLTQSGTASLVGGYRSGVTPAPWLTAGLSGSASDYTLVLSIAPQGLAMALGTYATTFTVATNDSAGNTLQARDIAVTFNLRDGLRISGFVNAFATAGATPAAQTSQFTVLSPAGINWTATSDVAWITPPSGIHTGPGTFDVTLDNTGLRADSHIGKVTLTNAQDVTDTAELTVVFVLQAPGMGIAPFPSGGSNVVMLGGNSGFESKVVPLRLTLDTGANEFPWTASLSGITGLTASVTSGMVSAAGSMIELSADRTQVQRGEYFGQLQVTANVNGTFVQAFQPVVLRVEDNQLVVEANGVALSSFPGRSVLQRTVHVYDSWDSSATQWQASDDQSWLTVTPSGSAGGNLVLTANPAGLADGQYTATVTITSNTARVANDQTIRVGFTVRSTDPVVLIDQAVPASQLAVNPVEPEVYVCDSFNTITVYDIYSGASLRTIPATNCFALLVSGDGRTLFMQTHNGFGFEVDAMDPASGTVQATYFLNTTMQGPVAYVRPDGHPLLVSNGETIDLVSGQPVPQGLVTSNPFGVARNQRALYTRDLFDLRSTYAIGLRYSVLFGSPVMFSPIATNTGQAPTEVRGTVNDLALSSSDDKVFVAAAPPVGQLDVLNAEDLLFSGALPVAEIPNNAESSWNGLLAVGAGVVSGDDLWIYDQAGAERARLDSGSGSLFSDTVKFSGDGTRIVSGSSDGMRIQDAPIP
jgi:hypothetical protein